MVDVHIKHIDMVIFGVSTCTRVFRHTLKSTEASHDLRGTEGAKQPQSAQRLQCTHHPHHGRVLVAHDGRHHQNIHLARFRGGEKVEFQVPQGCLAICQKYQGKNMNYIELLHRIRFTQNKV